MINTCARILLVFALLVASPAFAFTQSGLGTAFGNGIPMGHEFVTRLAAFEVIGGDPVLKPDPKDPRKTWTQGLAKNIDITSAKSEVDRIRKMKVNDDRYQSAFGAILDAIRGERWVDIGGFNVANSMIGGKLGSINCHDVVTQEPAEIQYDHFMRRYDDANARGGYDAAMRSRQRFIDYFVQAAIAPPTRMMVWDSGGTTALVEVDRNYFLLGRAMHLLQDSFSTEHTVRAGDDNLERLLQVKSYLCAFGSEQHSHDIDAVLNFTSGDVIWLPSSRGSLGWGSYKPSNMKTPALVATEASKDLWAAFFRTMALPIEQRELAARSEAERIVSNWMGIKESEAMQWYDEEQHRDKTYVLAQGQSGTGNQQPACMTGLALGSDKQSEVVARFEREQRYCIFNVIAKPGYADLFDPSMHMPFNWGWQSMFSWQDPPADYTIPVRPADTGVRVRIRSGENNQYMTTDATPVADAWVYCRAKGAPLDLIMVGDREHALFRLTMYPTLFLSYRDRDGAVKLYDAPTRADFDVQPIGGTSFFSMRNNYWKVFLWLSGESPYLTAAGDPMNRNAQWSIEGLR